MHFYSHMLIYFWRGLHASHHHAPDVQLTEHIVVAYREPLTIVRANADLDRREVAAEQAHKVRIRRTMHTILAVGARYWNHVKQVGQRVGQKCI